MLQQGGAEKGAVDSGGGRGVGELHQERRRRPVENTAKASWAAAMRQELSTAMDELSSSLRETWPHRS